MAESALNDIRGDQRTSPNRHGAQFATQQQEEAKRLFRFAEREGFLKKPFGKFPSLDLPHFPNPNLCITKGEEHLIFEIGGRAHKVTHNFAGFGRRPMIGADGTWESGGWFDATAGDYLERLILSNQIFNTDFELEGYGVLDGIPVVEISQSWVKFDPREDGLREVEVDALMAELGFEKKSLKGDNIFVDAIENIVVGDLHDGNIVKGHDGNVYVLDAMIARF